MENATDLYLKPHLMCFFFLSAIQNKGLIILLMTEISEIKIQHFEAI